MNTSKLLKLLIVTIAFPICSAIAVAIISGFLYMITSSMCVNYSSMELFNNFLFGIPIANTACEINSMYFQHIYSKIITQILIGVFFVAIIIVTFIANTMYISTYLCLVYHFDDNYENRTNSWFECLKCGSYTNKKVWEGHDRNTFIIVSIFNWIAFLTSRIFNNYATDTLWLFMLLVFPTIAIIIKPQVITIIDYLIILGSRIGVLRLASETNYTTIPHNRDIELQEMTNIENTPERIPRAIQYMS